MDYLATNLSIYRIFVVMPVLDIKFPATLSGNSLESFILGVRTAFSLIKAGREDEAKKKYPKEYSFAKKYRDLSKGAFTEMCMDRLNQL